ncbi:DUF72 domain-containing protein [Geochorda subterranea]|uniref:DUF72 domain-containing protein n=1 Tax=Geochorda subterranea TaxID=3109564 RepID=A0ABZ1BPP1_9FIRM|nr:DUF72 domain-containing protein [Limnochorda sp. LNt]WRP14801.1 DUF72 domain-containing protein [Limnochorda sp. LNt]
MIIVGTSGYAYDDWKGPFYPRDLKPGDYLAYYARFFRFTELNVTYYRSPSPFMLARVADKTPDGFEFAVKAFSALTHERGDPEEARRFRAALAPLEERRKLACVLLQFPNSFRPGPQSSDYLRRLREVLADVPVAVEFRHRGWVEGEQGFALLEELGAGFVAVDEPRIGTLVPPIARATGPLAYVRFHGRNREKWWHHQQAYERYDYLYSPEELQEWVPRLVSLEAQTGRVYVAMNNHYQAKSVINARMLEELLAAAPGR